jgi:hypothetical protein
MLGGRARNCRLSILLLVGYNLAAGQSLSEERVRLDGQDD